jgi:signal transduction histidine kinase
MTADERFARYQELQGYVGWTEEDCQRIRAAGPLIERGIAALVADFYEEIQRHPEAAKVITGGAAQIERLKGTLTVWIHDLFTGPYDKEYVARRWRVGWRHVEIGLDQVYTNVALSRLRRGMLRTLQENWTGDFTELIAVRQSINTLLDLDLAIIEDAYQAEHQRRQQRVERLAAIGQLSAGVAHEVRNPLNVVKTSVYYLLNARNLTPAKMAEHLQRIERNVGIADNVITTLSSFARLPVPNLQPFALERCLRETLENNPPGDHLQVTVDVPADLPPVLGDIDQLRIVFGNLIRNAREAMPGSGNLGLAARPAGEYVEVAVSDTGGGISPENLAHIMEPLFSTKARGLGLGLAIARSILEKNHGTLSVHTTIDKGSTFLVRLRAVPS